MVVCMHDIYDILKKDWVLVLKEVNWETIHNRCGILIVMHREGSSVSPSRHLAIDPSNGWIELGLGQIENDPTQIDIFNPFWLISIQCKSSDPYWTPPILLKPFHI